ncbi:LysR family transcriptional regulator [Gluconacetobacter diazotrophicus]|uniref:LysR family transcriptional regulator n=1 Tax=Gluconacetobacter diazotrophicus TaxID=33996 RepID=A0A7W4I725_GLUDI|nr:LysR substrate-binding domain-containing protein [Gluconacetobacter diazotrophicus]MBB2157457.1 LysR family transcriptional regulator [Gluconacetobacter diazotrophicus]
MISELRTFSAAARLGSFAAAAERVGLTQSAVSAQIRRLEQELGHALFERTGRSVTLSAAGHLSLGHAENILALFDKMRDPAADIVVHGRLRVGAISTTHTTILAPAVASLRVNYPALTLHIVPGVSMGLMDRLDAGELDAVIIVRPPFGLMPHLGWHPLVRQHFVLVVPAHLPPDDWRQIIISQPFIRYDRRSFGGRTVDRFLQAQGFVPNTAIETEEVHAILQMVASDMGVAIVPYILAVRAMPNIRVVPLGEHTILREIGVLTMLSWTSPALDALIAHLVQACPGDELPSDARAGEQAP